MTTSRLEQAKNDIIDEFQVISVANGYRTTPKQVIGAIRHPNDINDFIEIGIEFGIENVKPIDQAWTTFNSTIPVFVAAAVKADTDLGNDDTNLEAAAELIRHDMKRVIATIMSKYVNTAGNWWNVSPNTAGIEFGSITGEGMKRNIAVVGCSFDIQIRHQDYLFQADPHPPTNTSRTPVNAATQDDTVWKVITLSFSAITDATTYRVQVSTDSTFVVVSLLDTTNANTTRELTTCVDGTTYYWRFMGINSKGNSGWSDTWSFTANDLLPVNTARSPVDAAQDQATNLTISFTTPAADATTFQLQVSTDISFGSTFYDTTDGTTSRAITGFSLGTTYYWRFKGIKTSYETHWSSIYSFKTVLADVKLLLAPSEFANNLGTGVFGGTTKQIQCHFFNVWDAITVQRVGVWVAAHAGGSIDIAVFDAAGTTKLFSTGWSLLSETNDIHWIALGTPTLLAYGTYILAVSWKTAAPTLAILVDTPSIQYLTGYVARNGLSANAANDTTGIGTTLGVITPRTVGAGSINLPIVSLVGE
jgi:hypothetical protein